MDKVLIITHDFLPYSSSFGACARMTKLSIFLKAKGVEVHCLSSSGIEKNYYGYESQIEGVQQYFIQNQFKIAKDRSNVGGSSSLLSGVKNFTKKLLLPDINVLYVNAFYKKALEIILKENIRYCLISSPPHSIQLVGKKLRNSIPGLKIIGDFRDSWNTSGYFKRKNPILRALNHRLERRAISNMNLLSYASPPMLKKINALHGMDFSEKAILVMNGYDDQNIEINPKPINLNDKISFGYFGSLISSNSSYQNIKPTLDAIKENEALANRIVIRLYGEIQLLNLNPEEYPFLEIHEKMTYKESLKKMQETDVLFILHSDDKNCDEVITGKFFDYVFSEKPILIISHPQMEAMNLVLTNKLGFGVDLSKGQIADQFQKVLKDLESFKISESKVNKKEFSADFQFEKLYERILKLNPS